MLTPPPEGLVNNAKSFWLLSCPGPAVEFSYVMTNPMNYTRNSSFTSVISRRARDYMGHTPSTAGTFRKKFRKNSGKTPETLSERFLEFPSRVRLGCPKPYNSRHLKAPERFQNSLPPSTAGDASFLRSGSGEGPLRVGHRIPGSTGCISDYMKHMYRRRPDYSSNLCPPKI